MLVPAMAGATRAVRPTRRAEARILTDVLSDLERYKGEERKVSTSYGTETSD